MLTVPEEAVAPLLGWYGANKRSLPWRDNPTPYRVWISEIMLQQTRVEAVKPYYRRFMAELPDVESLAAVDEDRLMKLWEGRGYYSRARNLKKAARLVVDEYGGVFPHSRGIAETARSRRLHGRGGRFDRDEPSRTRRGRECAARRFAPDREPGGYREAADETGVFGCAAEDLSARTLRRLHAGADGARRDGLSAERRTDVPRLPVAGALRRLPRGEHGRNSGEGREKSAEH